MQYRTFGRTGWQVSEIAFGGWQLGGEWGTVLGRRARETARLPRRRQHGFYSAERGQPARRGSR